MQYGALGRWKHEQNSRSETKLDDVTMSREGGYLSSTEVIECCSLKGLGEHMLKHED